MYVGNHPMNRIKHGNRLAVSLLYQQGDPWNVCYQTVSVRDVRFSPEKVSITFADMPVFKHDNPVAMHLISCDNGMGSHLPHYMTPVCEDILKPVAGVETEIKSIEPATADPGTF
jgi:hypothetical protein